MRKGWNKKKLKEVADYFIGLTYSPKDVSDKGTIVLRSSNIQNSKLDLSDIVRVSKTIKENLKVKDGDILMCSRNGSKRLVGKTATIQGLKDEMTFGAFMTVIRSQFNPFLSWFFISDEFRSQIGVGENTMINQITKYMLDDIEVLIPPLAEQQRIISTLDEAFAAIAKAKANTEKNLQNAKELFDSYLHGVFANPGEDWEEKTLADVYDVRDGTHDSPKYQDSGFPLITSKNLKKDRLTYDLVNYISKEDYIDINKRSKVDKGDVLFAMIGTIGNPVVIEDKPDFAIKNVALFKVPKDQDSYFLKYYLDTKFTIDKMMSDAKGTTQKFVGLGYLRSFPIILPPLKAQQSIVSLITSFKNETQKLVTIYQQKLNDLEELKKSILQKAFSGELKTKQEVLA